MKRVVTVQLGFNDLPTPQSWPVNPEVHRQRYLLSVKPDWQIALFLQGDIRQAFWKTKTKNNKRK